MSDDAEALVTAQRERGAVAGREWAKTLKKPPTRMEAIEESDRRYPDSHPDFIAMYNLSGGFIDGALEENS